MFVPQIANGADFCALVEYAVATYTYYSKGGYAAAEVLGLLGIGAGGSVSAVELYQTECARDQSVMLETMERLLRSGGAITETLVSDAGAHAVLPTNVEDSSIDILNVRVVQNSQVAPVVVNVLVETAEMERLRFWVSLTFILAVLFYV